MIGTPSDRLCQTTTNDFNIMSQAKFSIKKVSNAIVLTVWEEALIEGDRIRAFTYKINFRCLSMDEAKSRLQLVTNGDWSFDID